MHSCSDYIVAPVIGGSRCFSPSGPFSPVSTIRSWLRVIWVIVIYGGERIQSEDLALVTATKAKVRIISRSAIRARVDVVVGIVARAVARVISIVIDVGADGFGGCFNSCPGSCEGLICYDCRPSSFSSGGCLLRSGFLDRGDTATN
jgi:hypothetical protein